VRSDAGPGVAEKLKGPVAQHSRQKVEPVEWDKFVRDASTTIGGEFHDDQTYIELKGRASRPRRPKAPRATGCSNLSEPPTAFPMILQKLQRHGLIERQQQGSERPACRVIVEKPFGTDLKSAAPAQRDDRWLLTESQILPDRSLPR